MNVEQQPEMSEEYRKKLAVILGQEPTVYDQYRALFDWDGTSRDINPIFEEVKYEVKVTKLSIHQPGEIVTMSDGRQYEVQDDGKWMRVKGK